MRSKCTQLLMLVAWLLATGSHLDLVQTFAWGRMFASNARVLPLLDAAELTFSPNALCGICQAVQDAKHNRSDGAAASSPTEGKAPLVFQPAAAVVIAAPGWHARVTIASIVIDHERAAPPLPPPRAVA